MCTLANGHDSATVFPRVKKALSSYCCVFVVVQMSHGRWLFAKTYIITRTSPSSKIIT
jgi:hypothetical protein